MRTESSQTTLARSYLFVKDKSQAAIGRVDPLLRLDLDYLGGNVMIATVVSQPSVEAQDGHRLETNGNAVVVRIIVIVAAPLAACNFHVRF